MNKQGGVALSGLIFWGIMISLLAVLGMKVVPIVAEYMKIKKDTKAVVTQLGQTATVSDVKDAFRKFAAIDQLSISPDELEISKDSGQIVISFAYEKRIPLFANASLLLEFQGTTAGQ